VSVNIRVLIVDDSAFTRQVLKSLLETDPAIDVVGVAADPVIAWDKIRRLQPDVLTLDVEMPQENGLSFLERLMREHPLPVVMVSSLTADGCSTTLTALELGAVDFVTKPQSDVRTRLPEIAHEIIEKIRAAAVAHVRRPASPSPLRSALLPRPKPLGTAPSCVIAIGASTGGTEAIREILMELPADCPGIVIVQHMPPKFTRAFAERLDSLCRLRVKEAEQGDSVLDGQALIAPGGFHLRITRDGQNYAVRLSHEAPVNRHRPSVDLLFASCAEEAPRNAIGVLLTGMGEDGTQGLLEMRKAGARTLAQDEASCVVFGMPKVAIDRGAVEQVLPLRHLAGAVLALAQNRRRGLRYPDPQQEARRLTP
jgi:two-component system chemotaxis response regulator CheB